MIHVYGVVDELVELPPVAGLDDAPLERRSVEGVEIVLSRARSASTEVSREAVLRHAQVVEELMARSGAILPAQLGRAFRDDDELAAALREEAPRLVRGLQRVRGCAEYGLRAIPTEVAEHEAVASGAEYMRTRLERIRRQDRLVSELHEPLARLARENTLHRDAAGEIRAAYLVELADASSFRDAVARVEASPELTVVCTGPWPPYSFAGEKTER
jgi:gas vesicle protein GvpL/GvpF